MKPIRCLALAALFLPVLASAHPGHDGHELTWDFAGGAAHPLSGWDHWLAMLAVGIWAAKLGGRSRWLVPATFASMMTLGAIIGRIGWMMPGTEQGIAASILALGLLIASAVRLPAAASMPIVGAFALFHGLAHGAEMPATAGGLAYGAGFVAVTVMLHAAGLGLGLAFRNQDRVARFAGAGVALAGAVALFA